MDSEVKQGDCLDLLAKIPAESVRLIYLDPPFFTQRLHSLRTRDRNREFSFPDLWASHSEYAEFLFQRLVQCQHALADNGSIFFHCDRQASHVVRGILDQVFGGKNFRSEIIWQYRRWSNSQRTLLPSHQTIYFYSKTERYVFNPIYLEYSPSTNIDQILQRRKRDEHGKTVYDRDETGRIISSSAKKGVPLGDVWDIPYLNPKAKERVGYPTQKPILLVERIICLATNLGDLVVDPFCGSGTTLVAATLNGRQSLGIDISEEAVLLTKKRLADPVRTQSSLLQAGRDSYRKSDTTALAHLVGTDCVPVHRNRGIDAILVEQFGGRPVPVRVQRNNESVEEAATLLGKAGKTKHAQRMVLVVTAPGQTKNYASTLPPGMIAIESTSVHIARAIGKPEPSSAQTTLFDPVSTSAS